jgi:hypothetical protein
MANGLTDEGLPLAEEGDPDPDRQRNLLVKQIGGGLTDIGTLKLPPMLPPRPPPNKLVAYHGSPYDFSQFDTSKIGTGEGGKIYGHGFYAAENPAVAKSYAPAVPELPWWHPANLWTKSQAPQQGGLYQVGIDAHPDEFMDWEKPFSQQSETVQGALTSSGLKLADYDELYNRYKDHPMWTEAEARDYAGWKSDPAGHEIYTNAPYMPRPADFSVASQRLNDAGIKGIRYLDRGSRAAGQGTHNYVIFDPKIMNVLKKNGIDVLRGNATLDEDQK